MTLPHLVIAPDPRLRRKTPLVGKVDSRIAKLMDEMLTVMYPGNGIGLAAPQIGVLESVIVMDTGEKRDGTEAICLADPEIVWKSEETMVYREGCLSLPDIWIEITRPEKIRVSYLDQHNKSREIEAKGLEAICLQHEIDHLHGVLFVDYVSQLKREMILRRLDKAKKHGRIET